MLATRIIPCLDVDNGRVVKGVQFVDIVDAGDPVEAAIRYYMQGADELCFLDITASHQGRDTTYDMVRDVARNIFIPLTVGGGVRSLADIDKLLESGADKVSINSAAVDNPQLIRDASNHFGNQCIVVALDAKTTGATDSGFEIFVHGGRRETGIDAIEWAKRMDDYGAGEILLTSMGRDGTKKGYDIPLTRSICDAVTIPVIASGGVGELSHLVDGVTKGHASAVLAASIFHFGEYTVGDAKKLMREEGLIVR